MYIHQPDIGLTEAFSKTSDNTCILLSEYCQDGVQSFCNSDFENKGNRGTLFFVRNGIEENLYQNLINMSCKEACWYEVKANNNEKLLIEVIDRQI